MNENQKAFLLFCLLAAIVPGLPLLAMLALARLPSPVVIGVAVAAWAVGLLALCAAYVGDDDELDPAVYVYIVPQPERIDCVWWLCDGAAFTTEDMESYLYHDVYGNYRANDIAEDETAAPVLVDGAWYWRRDRAG